MCAWCRGKASSVGVCLVWGHSVGLWGSLVLGGHQGWGEPCGHMTHEPPSTFTVLKASILMVLVSNLGDLDAGTLVQPSKMTGVGLWW